MFDKLNWESHYTGTDHIDIGGNCDGQWPSVYMSRYTHDKKVKFVRVGVFHRMEIGVFLGHVNTMGHPDRGFEVFDHKYHFGYICPSKWGKSFQVKWSGSIAEPYHAWTIKIGHKKLGWIGFGRTSWKWLITWKDRKAQKLWEKEAEAMALAFPNDYESMFEDDGYHD